MKGTFFMAIIIVFCMLVIPLSALKDQPPLSLPASNAQSSVPYETLTDNTPIEKIKVLKNGEVLEFSLKDYLFGVVAAEMPALYEEEALKAQTVAAYTFVCYKKSYNSNLDYDISAEAETAQCFITRQETAARWGDKADEYASKLDRCISAVMGQFITHNNQIILAAYHALSAGKTNSCQDVWNKDLPYLQSVDSSSDTLAENFLTTVTLTVDEISEKLKSFSAPSSEPQNYFTDILKTDNGYVKSLKYCNKELSGNDLRNALNLRSCHFEIAFLENVFTFTVKGYGHGVGMSQTGANALAKQGKNYEEILLYYYPNTVLQKK